MSTSEFPELNPGAADAGTTAQTARDRAKPMVLRNSRILCWLTMGIGICALCAAACMAIMFFTELFPIGALSFTRGLSALQWGLGAVALGSMCPWLWAWGRMMENYAVKLDERGVDFNLGTKKQPEELFMGWEQVDSIEQKRVGNAQQFTVRGTDGSMARFSSYTFMRPKKVARVIAERAGKTITKG
jgi:hypothetical protein